MDWRSRIADGERINLILGPGQIQKFIFAGDRGAFAALELFVSEIHLGKQVDACFDFLPGGIVKLPFHRREIPFLARPPSAFFTGAETGLRVADHRGN